MNIYLIRHGDKNDDDKNYEQLELTEKGFMQADLLGRRMKSYNIQKIYSSSMIRAVQTAEQMNKYLNVEIDVRPELKEIHMGAGQTEGWDYFGTHYPEFLEEFNKHEKDLPYPPDGECGDDVWKRASKVLFEIADSDLENVAVVAHGGTIRILIAGLLHLGQERRFYLGTPLENCSISLIKYNKKDKAFILHSFNDHGHLEDWYKTLME